MPTDAIMITPLQAPLSLLRQVCGFQEELPLPVNGSLSLQHLTAAAITADD